MMPDNLANADPREKPRRRFQFSLRTLFVVVTALCVLLAQWPSLEWELVPPNHADYPQLMANEIRHLPANLWTWRCHVPTRVWQVVAAEAVAIAGWQLLAWMRRRSSERDACIRS